MAKVKLINYTPDALELLLYTKNTRLQGAQSLEEIKAWSYEHKLVELSYMRDTIQSSWEFATYVFEITEVTRAFTHQLVRTRTGSYAQQSQRTVDVREMGYESTGDRILDSHGIETAIALYGEAIDNGIPVQDARGALPINMHTEIIAQFNLRTLHNMAETRLCTRTQGEYQEVFKMMKAEVVKVNPWAEEFIEVFCVNYGTCCFPRYKECPIQRYVVDVSPSRKQHIKNLWDETNHEAIPVAKDGRTM
jgi:thymidylate synthase ThyX